MRIENMKRVAFCWVLASAFAALVVSFAPAQSEALGDYARQVRKQKSQKPAANKQFDEYSMTNADSISVVGQPRAQAPEGDAAKSKDHGAEEQSQNDGETKDQAAPQDPSKPDGGSRAATKAPKKDEASDREKFNQDWQKRLDEQKKQIDLLSRELDVLQREYRLRAAAMYADAGNRMRNAGQWDKEDADYKQKIAAKQQSVDDAKQKLEDMKEEARKAGVPTVYRE